MTGRKKGTPKSPWDNKEGDNKGGDNKAGNDGEHHQDEQSSQSYDNVESLWQNNARKRSKAGSYRSNGGEPPEFDEIIGKVQHMMERMMPSGFNPNLIILILVVMGGIWAATGIYRVGPAERGVELVFGKYTETTLPGLRYNYPAPIGEVFLPSVDLQRRMNVGFRSQESLGNNQSQTDIASESLMLTSDENIVDLDFTVFWRIGDPRYYLFYVRDQEATLKVVAESAMREVIGQTTFDRAVTTGRDAIEQNTLEVMQRILDSYQSGILVEAVELQASDPPADVIDAFNDVQRARQDRDRLSNEAQAYANSIVPQARGEAERMLREAEGYKTRLIEEAKGEAQRFQSVYDSYESAPEVTRQRMYLEVLGKVYRQADKIVVDPEISGQGGQGIVPYLPLNELNKTKSNNDQ